MDMQKFKSYLEELNKSSYIRKIKLLRNIDGIDRFNFSIYPEFGTVSFETYKPEWKKYVEVETLLVRKFKKFDEKVVRIELEKNWVISIFDDELITLDTPKFFAWSVIDKIS